MLFPGLLPATLLRRYKRFLADVRLESGEELTVHCPNTGAMTGCAEPGSRVWLHDSGNPKRKYRYTWELVESGDGHLACVHSARANALVAEALAEGALPFLEGYPGVAREVAFGGEGSRVDFLLDGPRGQCLVEVKSVTLHVGDGLGLFPDAPSVRGRKHLRELARSAAAGRRALLLFVAQHSGIQRVAPADRIDPAYGEALREAMAAGVEVHACGVQVAPQEMVLVAGLAVLERQPGKVT